MPTTLLDPLNVGDWRLPNRVVLAPLTRTRASAGRVPNTLMAVYYRQRAGAGLMLSEATSVTPMGVGYPDTPGDLYSMGDSNPAATSGYIAEQLGWPGLAFPALRD